MDIFWNYTLFITSIQNLNQIIFFKNEYSFRYIEYLDIMVFVKGAILILKVVFYKI